MRHKVCGFSLVFTLLCSWSVQAQFDDPTQAPATKVSAPNAKGKAEEISAEKITARGVQLDTAETQLWLCGVNIRALGGPCGGLFGTISVPTDWPEQSVKVFQENITDTSVKKVAYRTVEGGVKQMLITVPQLNPGEMAKALVTFEVTRHSLKLPPDTTIFVLPQKMPLAIKKHLAASPLIEATQLKFKKVAQELTAGKTMAWEIVEALYDGTRERVKWENDKDKGALAALNDGKGQKEDVTGVFIALCRSLKIPARMVWVPDSCYAEFYLEDEQGNGYWIPCYLASEKKEFGFVSTHAPILQKGDNIKVPEKKEAQRFVAEFLTGKGAGGGRPEVEFVRRLELKP
jgi:Transglutaminase-like superfamily